MAKRIDPLNQYWFWAFLVLVYGLALYGAIPDHNWYACWWIGIAAFNQVGVIMFSRMTNDAHKLSRDILEQWGHTLDDNEEMLDRIMNLSLDLTKEERKADNDTTNTT